MLVAFGLAGTTSPATAEVWDKITTRADWARHAERCRADAPDLRKREPMQPMKRHPNGDPWTMFKRAVAVRLFDGRCIRVVGWCDPWADGQAVASFKTSYTVSLLACTVGWLLPNRWERFKIDPANPLLRLPLEATP